MAIVSLEPGELKRLISRRRRAGGDRWDEVWEGDRLVEVLVGPATFDVPSPTSGRLAVIHGLEDDRVAPGMVLGFVAVMEDGEDAADSGETSPFHRPS